MDHEQLHTLMVCAPNVRLTSAQAGELVAEFNRIKASLNDAMDRNASMHIELEQVKRVANDQAQEVRRLTAELETANSMHVDAVRFIWEERGFGSCAEMAEKFDKAISDRDALAAQVEHLKFVCKNMYTQYEWAMQTQMFNKTSAMAREIIDKPPHECLAAHDAEVAKAAFIEGACAFDCDHPLYPETIEVQAEEYASQLRAKAGE